MFFIVFSSSASVCVCVLVTYTSFQFQFSLAGRRDLSLLSLDVSPRRHRVFKGQMLKLKDTPLATFANRTRFPSWFR